MPTVELRMGDIQWPAKCCCCGTDRSSYRTHCEDVPIRSRWMFYEKREISLANLPVCDRCADAQMVWVGLGVLTVAVGCIAFFLLEKSNRFYPWLFAVIVLGIGIAQIGLFKAPIRILEFDESSNTIKLKVDNLEVAEEMMRRERARDNPDDVALR